MIDRYDNEPKCAEFQKVISDVLFGQLLAKRMLSTFVGFAIDESTDVGHTSQMIIYVFYVDVEDDYTFECEFFALVEVLGPSAEELFESMRERICAVKDRNGKTWLWDKWMAFGTDGPSVMTSPENGVRGLVKAVKPRMYAHHCIGHRAHLGARDCLEDIPFCSNLDEFLRALGKFYSWSTERRKELKAITMDNDDPQTQVDMSCATRWLSRDGAALSVLDKYESIVEQHYRGKDDNSTSLGLYSKLTDYRYCADLAHVSDILSQNELLCLGYSRRRSSTATPLTLPWRSSCREWRSSFVLAMKIRCSSDRASMSSSIR